MKAKIINCTPHSIVVDSTEFCVETGEWINDKRTFKTSGTIARVCADVKKEPEIMLDSTVLIEFKVESAEATGIEGLPEPKEGILYLVSSMVLDAGKKLGRNDLIAPNTNKAKRSEEGHIVSVPGFIM